MRSAIVGTAGHIDHGKSALVEALTGTHPDRLAEERRRGITIDLGFAHCDLAPAEGEAARLSFIDVPGHERFISNMLAGIGGIDLVMLVVAADAAVQPQTREHFEICRLLGVTRGVVAVSKRDLADEDALALTRMELDGLLKGTFLEAAPRVEVSARTGAGIAELKTALARMALEAPARDPRRPFRLPLDRVFSLKGFGAVVTGTLLAGTVARGEEIVLLGGEPGQPEAERLAGRRLRVRGLEVHGEPMERARAGQRAALNLAGVEAAELRRGLFAAPPNGFEPAGILYAEIELLQTARPLKPYTRLELHAYSATQAATLAPLEGGRLEPGGRALAELRLKTPLPLVPGDRFILRQFSPAETLGGGVVIETRVRRARRGREHVAWLRAWQASAAQPEAARRQLALLVQQAEPEGADAAMLALRTGWAQQEIVAGLTAGEEASELARSGTTWRLAEGRAAGEQAMLATLAEFHRQQPMLAGIGVEEWRRRSAALAATPEARQFQLEAERLAAARRVELRDGLYHLPGQGLRLNAEEEAARQRLEGLFQKAGLAAPAAAEALAATGLDAQRARRLLQQLVREQRLVQITPELLLHSEAMDELRRRLAEQKKKTRRLSVADFKQLTGLSRKYAIPILEYLDGQRVTRRAGEERELL